MGRDFDQIFRQTISVRRKALLKNTELVASRHIKRENTSFPGDVCRSKTSLSLLNSLMKSEKREQKFVTDNTFTTLIWVVLLIARAVK